MDEKRGVKDGIWRLKIFLWLLLSALADREISQEQKISFRA